MLHKDYLMQHKKVLFTTLFTQGKLYQHCAEVEKQAKDMYDTLIEQMKESEGITEQLKEENQLEWACRMQNIEARVREIIKCFITKITLLYLLKYTQFKQLMK